MGNSGGDLELLWALQYFNTRCLSGAAHPCSRESGPPSECLQPLSPCESAVPGHGALVLSLPYASEDVVRPTFVPRSHFYFADLCVPSPVCILFLFPH